MRRHAAKPTAVQTEKAVGLALSGGVVRGIAHIGVLEVLEQEGVPVHAIAGTSAGSIIGALYAAGVPLSEIKRRALTTRWNKLFKLTIPKMGLISGDGIASYMEEILPARNFSSLKIPFIAVAADLGTGNKVNIRSGSIAKAVQASCSLPVIFTPVKMNGRLLVDGGVASLVPARTARDDLGATVVIAVDVNYQALEFSRPDTVFKIAAHLSMLYATRNAREERSAADVLIPVSARGINLYDFSHAQELIRRGRKAAKQKIAEIRAALSNPKR